MSMTLDCTSALFLLCRNIEINFDGSDCVIKNANEPMVLPAVGSGGVCVWHEYGVRRSVLCWCVWQKCGFSRCKDVFTFNLNNVNIAISVRLLR
jgi:hypothetical protein